MPAHSQPPAVSIFAIMSRAWRLLARNPAIVIPGLIVGLFAGLVSALLTPSPEQITSGGLLGDIVDLVVETIATILSIAYTTGMANAAWERGIATFGDGALAFRRDGGRVFVALVILAVFGTVAALAAPFTIGLSFAVLAFFCVYAMPAAVVGERTGVRAVIESGEIAIERALPTSLMIVAIAVIVMVMGLVAALLGAVPFVGPIVRQIVVQFAIVYAMLVIVGEYRQLRLP